MARMPGAAWHPVRNYTKDGQDEVRGVVVHIMAGTLDGTQGWFNNATAQASSHFGTGKAGALRQWVDTDDRAWAQSAGNRTWLSVENEGQGGDALTDAQLERNAHVLAWAHEEYDVPLRLATGPDDEGLGYHAMGGSAWGGHTSCPGTRIVAQLPEIVARAKRLVAGPTKQEDDMPSPLEFWNYRNKNAKGKIPDAYGYLTGTAADVDALRTEVAALRKDFAALAALIKKGA